MQYYFSRPSSNVLSPGRWGFLAIFVSDTKISKLILCFSILLLQISCWVKKNQARLRGDDISSCINTQPIMINSLRKWTMRHWYACTYLSDRAKLREFKENLKLVCVILYQTFIFSSNERPSKAMKNVFYII